MYFARAFAIQCASAMLVAASPIKRTSVPSSAMIYRGASTCEDCPETVGRLLKEIYPKINIIFAGPDEDTQINAATLKNVDVFAQGGGDSM